MASKCSPERKIGTSLPFSQNLEVIKLSEEDMPEAEPGQNVALCPKQPSCECIGRELRVLLQQTHK